MTTAAAVSGEDVRSFVYREARLIDQKELDAWYDLFTEDALYWMPLARGQAEADIHTSLFYEDKFLLKVRIERLKNPRAASQQPPSFCQHVLQRPDVAFSAPRSAMHSACPTRGSPAVARVGFSGRRIAIDCYGVTAWCPTTPSKRVSSPRR